MTLEEAWQAFTAAVAEAQELQASGTGAEVLQSPLRRARELLAVIDAELAANLPPANRIDALDKEYFAAGEDIDQLLFSYLHRNGQITLPGYQTS